MRNNYKTIQPYFTIHKNKEFIIYIYIYIYIFYPLSTYYEYFFLST